MPPMTNEKATCLYWFMSCICVPTSPTRVSTIIMMHRINTGVVIRLMFSRSFCKMSAMLLTKPALAGGQVLSMCNTIAVLRQEEFRGGAQAVEC